MPVVETSTSRAVQEYTVNDFAGDDENQATTVVTISRNDTVVSGAGSGFHDSVWEAVNDAVIAAIQTLITNDGNISGGYVITAIDTDASVSITV